MLLTTSRAAGVNLNLKGAGHGTFYWPTDKKKYAGDVPAHYPHPLIGPNNYSAGEEFPENLRQIMSIFDVSAFTASQRYTSIQNLRSLTKLKPYQENLVG
jgi:hypothetical protein